METDVSHTTRCWPGLVGTVVAMVLLLGVLPASAAAEWASESPRLDDPALDAQRGGFRLGNMEIEIGLEQVVSVDGQIAIINRLLIPNLNQPASRGGVRQQVERVEVGRISTIPSAGAAAPTTTFSPAQQAAEAVISSTELRNGGWITSIQNDMNERVIQNIRSLNIKLKNVGRAGDISDRFGEHFLQSPSR